MSKTNKFTDQAERDSRLNKESMESRSEASKVLIALMLDQGPDALQSEVDRASSLLQSNGLLTAAGILHYGAGVLSQELRVYLSKVRNG
jgi:hypothetical protein